MTTPDPTDVIAGILDEEGYGYWIDARMAAEDAIDALAAAGLRIVPMLDDTTCREVPGVVLLLRENAEKWEAIWAEPAHIGKDGYRWLLKQANLERRAAELLAAAYLDQENDQ